MPKSYGSLEDGYRAIAAVMLRDGSCGLDAWSGGPSRLHTAIASSAQVKIVQATSRFRIEPNPSVV